jgi:hypothetical protein
MSRLICLILAFALASCAQHVNPYAPIGAQSTMPNIGAIATKPDDFPTAYVDFKNESESPTLFTVYRSYHEDLLWHEVAEKCVHAGDTWSTKVDYDHHGWEPQIRFVSTLLSKLSKTCSWTSAHRALSFHQIVFTHGPFEVRFRQFIEERRIVEELCGRGYGWNEVCSRTK